ncbi:Lrp/AsnC family transcriptional regulator [Candidatus Woesearchaeota archaeon]|jgi:Lrp/AsnC family transcriptional regulator, leucine-responsive regulatory protein|nr:Lrp/AsnC family transcriptional regulator [Candidatus Woesearchaeota archaeon]
MVKLTIKDMKILSELDFKARQPISQIAKKVGLSKEVTNYRIKQLEKKGVITGYYPIIDLSKLGYIYCRCNIELERVGPEIEEKFLDFTKKTSQLGWFVVRDNMNICLSGFFKSIEEIKMVMDSLEKNFYSVIRTKKPSIATKIYHFKRNYLYNKKDDEELVWGGVGLVKIDETDKKILHSLTKDVRVPSTEIAKKVGFTSMAVSNRIKRMEREKLILGYRCSLNLEKLGYSHHKIMLFMENFSFARKLTLLQFLRMHPNAVYVVEVLDSCDLEFEVQVKSMAHLYEFMKEMRKKFPEIKSFESFPFYREEIIRYVPGDF